MSKLCKWIYIYWSFLTLTINGRCLLGKNSRASSSLWCLLRQVDRDERFFLVFEIDFVKPAAKVHFLAHEDWPLTSYSWRQLVIHKDVSQNYYIGHMLRGAENFFSLSLRWKFLAGNKKKKKMSILLHGKWECRKETNVWTYWIMISKPQQILII